MTSPRRPPRKRLCPALLGHLPSGITRPAYDRESQRSGIVHFGPGAFHRAHQAVYTEDALAAGDRDWRILGISLRSRTVYDQMMPQQCLYSVTECGGSHEPVRIVGSVAQLLIGSEDAPAVIEAVAASQTKLISFTITEKGYCRALRGGLDFENPALRRDLACKGVPETIYGFLREGLARRRSSGLPGLTLLSCDNLASNGTILRESVQEYLEAVDKPLASWFAAECTCPSTMVDRIVPATTEVDRERMEERIGCRDEAAITTEPFRQWVIEDRFSGPRPRWSIGGAEFVSDIHGYEITKLRMLNGAHSALAYLGLNVGHSYVHQAIADANIRSVVVELLRGEAASTLPEIQGFDRKLYCDRLLTRFENEDLPYSLYQIAMDGSQKVPQRWLPTLRENGRAGRRCPALLTALAGWLLYLRGDRHTVIDPMAETLQSLWRTVGRAGVAAELFASGGLFAGHWTATADDLATLNAHLATA